MKNINADSMSDCQAGDCFVWDENKEEARRVLELALARAGGMPEPELYDHDPQTKITNKSDDDKLAQVVEIQTRMETGMDMIKERECFDELESLVEGYIATKADFAVAKEFMYPLPDGGWIQKYWDRYNEVKDTRDLWYKAMSEMAEKLGIADLKRHWWVLKEESADIIGKEKAIWALYFQIEDKEEWLALYQVDELVTNKDAHKQVAPDLDSRMLVTDEIYCITHCEEEELFLN